MRPPPRNINVPDIVGGSIIFVLGLMFLIGGMGYGIWSPDGQLEPGAMPALAGSLLALFGLAIAINAARPRNHSAGVPRTTVPGMPVEAATGSPGTAGDAPNDPIADGTGTATGPAAPGDEAVPHSAPGTTAETTPAFDNPRRALVLFALTAVAVAAISWFDIFIVLAVLVTTILVFFEKVRLWKAALVAGILVVLCYLVFAVLLRVPLPTIF